LLTEWIDWTTRVWLLVRVLLTTQLCLVHGDLPPYPLHAFMEQCLGTGASLPGI